MTDRMTNPAKNREQKSMYLRPEDQRSMVCVVLCMLAWMAGSLALYAYNSGGLVHVDNARKNEFVFQVDVNEADWTELSALPTIGETMARRIVSFRESNGPYTSLQSLKLVDGIGIHTLRSIQPHIAGLPDSDMMADAR